MTDENETVDDIVRELRRGVRDWKGDALHIFDDLAERIESAHKRECEEAEKGKYSVESYKIVMHNQEAQITILRKAIRRYRSYYKIRKIERMKAENERLRDGLTGIIEMLQGDTTTRGEGLRDIAEAALEASDESVK